MSGTSIPPRAGWLEALRGAPGIDVEQGLLTLGGMVEPYHRLLSVFLEHHRDDGRRIAGHVGCGEAARAGQIAHRLRGGAVSLGLVDVEATAAAVEAAVDGGADPAGPALALVDALDATVAQLARALRA